MYFCKVKGSFFCALTSFQWLSQLGVMLNSLKRLLDTLRPKMETQMKAWVACLPGEGAGHGRVVFGERLNEVTIELRAKYKNFLQAIVEKLADNVISFNLFFFDASSFGLKLEVVM